MPPITKKIVAPQNFGQTIKPNAITPNKYDINLDNITVVANSSGGRFLRIHNDSTSTTIISILGIEVSIGKYLDLQWNGSSWATETIQGSGNIIAIAKNVVNTSELIWDNFKVKMASGASIQLATVAGTKSVSILTEQEYPGGSFSNGFGVNGTPVSLTTTYIAIDDGVNVAGERFITTIMDYTLNKLYRVTMWRHNTTAGNWSGWVEDIGITTNQILSAGNQISLNNGVISNPNSLNKTSAIGSAIAGTQSILGEIEYRYNANAGNGNLEIKSSSASTLQVFHTSFERYAGSRVGDQSGSTSGLITLNSNAGAFTTLTGGGGGTNEEVHYTITTATNVYIIKIYNFNNTNIHILANKAF